VAGRPDLTVRQIRPTS